jgi:hypothetical protein
MSPRHEATEQVLKRILANGPLTALPLRRADEALLLRMAAARFEAQRPYREAEVNDLLRDWLATFSAPHGIDHVTLRRRLVDSRLLLRDSAGSSYRVAPNKSRQLAADESLKLEPARLLAEIRDERAARKRQHVT